MQPPPKQLPPPLGDATSQLVQIICRDVGLKFIPTQKGAEDIRKLVCEAYNTRLVVEALWKMCREFTTAIDEAGESVPEAFKAIVSAGILQAKSNVELGRKQ